MEMAENYAANVAKQASAIRGLMAKGQDCASLIKRLRKTLTKRTQHLWGQEASAQIMSRLPSLGD